MDKLKNTRILGIVGLSALLIGTFLPYIVVKFFGVSDTISLFGYWEGKVMLLVTFANILFVFKDYVKKYVPQLFEKGIGKSIEDAKPIFSLIPTGIAVLLNIYLFTTLDLDSSYMSYGLGFYIIWIGMISMVAYAILYKGLPEQPTDAVPASADATVTPAVSAAPTPVESAPVSETPVAPTAPAAEPTAIVTPTEAPAPVAEPVSEVSAAPTVVTESPVVAEPAPAVEPAPATPTIEQPINTTPVDQTNGGIDINNQQ